MSQIVSNKEAMHLKKIAYFIPIVIHRKQALRVPIVDHPANFVLVVRTGGKNTLERSLCALKQKEKTLYTQITLDLKTTQCFRLQITFSYKETDSLFYRLCRIPYPINTTGRKKL